MSALLNGGQQSGLTMRILGFRVQLPISALMSVIVIAVIWFPGFARGQDPVVSVILTVVCPLRK